MKKFNIAVGCKGNDGKTGAFLMNGKGEQLTPTFIDAYSLVNSSIYQEIRHGKVAYKIAGSGKVRVA